MIQDGEIIAAGSSDSSRTGPHDDFALARYTTNGTLDKGFGKAAVATAGRGEAQKQITTADQARAKAMLLRRTDLGPGFKASKSSQDNEDDSYCRALDESDLVITGDADSPGFTMAETSQPRVLSAGSTASVYKTAAQAAKSWRRLTSAGGMKCMELEGRREADQLGAAVTSVSLRKIAFPRLAPDTFAFRLTLSITKTASIVSDVVVLRDGRAVSAVMFGGLPSPFPRAEEVRLAKIVASRTNRRDERSVAGHRLGSLRRRGRIRLRATVCPVLRMDGSPRWSTVDVMRRSATGV